MAESKSAQDYMLRVAADEIDYLEQDVLLRQLPHVVKFIKHPVGRFLLRHVQNFCWTSERYMRRQAKAIAAAPLRTMALPMFDAGRPAANEARPKVWLDITNTRRVGFHGGIERAALKLAKAGVETGLALPVFIDDGEIYEYTGASGRGAKLQLASDITYVIADSFWQQIDEYEAICGEARRCGAKVAICIHDVILLYYPSFNRPEFARTFAAAFRRIIPCCDAVVASSVYTREKVRLFVDRMQLDPTRSLALTHFYLGADGHVCVDLRKVGERVRNIFARPNVFLSVGTLEPRKGYAVSLDAFDRLWERGIDCSFLIIGRPGWLSRALERRIIEHPRYGKSLHWLDGASDAEVTYAYRNAHCVLQTSITEGFGLPIVEASLEGTPVIATDNEIFHELGGDEIAYFRSCDSADLAQKVEAAIVERPRAGRLHPLKWDQSLALMVARVAEALELRQAA